MAKTKMATKRGPNKKQSAGVMAAAEIEKCYAAREAAKRETAKKKQAYEAAQDHEAQTEKELKAAHEKQAEIARSRR